MYAPSRLWRYIELLVMIRNPLVIETSAQNTTGIYLKLVRWTITRLLAVLLKSKG